MLQSLLQGQPQFLPVEQAFVLDYRQQDNELLLSWTIADGYYLYKDKDEKLTYFVNGKPVMNFKDAI